MLDCPLRPVPGRGEAGVLLQNVDDVPERWPTHSVDVFS
jgi:hypothetical protein